MPKNPSILLREELSKNQYELLDIYRFKDHDLVRVKHSVSNRVYTVRVSKHITDLVSIDDVRDIVKSILEQIKSIEEGK